MRPLDNPTRVCIHLPSHEFKPKIADARDDELHSQVKKTRSSVKFEMRF